MAIKRIKPAYVLGTNISNPKVLGSKVDEIIEKVNNLTTTVDDLSDGSIETTDLTLTGTLNVDVIDEETATTGVTIDGALIKDSAFDTNVAAAGVTLSGTTLAADGTDANIDINITPKGSGDVVISTSITLPDGLVSDLAVKIGADENNGLYGVSDVQLGVAIEGALVAGFDANGIFTSTISEQVATVGVTIDSVLLKDGGVSNTGVTMISGFVPLAAQQALSGPGAVNVTAYYTAFTSTGTGDALTLADGTQIGQLKKITYVGEAAGTDTGVLTPVNLSGGTTITLNAVGNYVGLMWNGTDWYILENSGCTVA